MSNDEELVAKNGSRREDGAVVHCDGQDRRQHRRPPELHEDIGQDIFGRGAHDNEREVRKAAGGRRHEVATDQREKKQGEQTRAHQHDLGQDQSVPHPRQHLAIQIVQNPLPHLTNGES